MVEVVTKENANLYRSLLDDMFRMRYRVAVEQWGWKIPNIEPGYDKDQFDTDDSIYFICPDATETKALACGRLNPTTQPHLLSEIFSDHCEFQDVPRSPTIYEFSRYIVDHQSMTHDQQMAVRARIPAAINKFCLEAKIKQLSLLAYMNSYARTVKVWKTVPLGLPKKFKQDEGTYIAALSEMTEDGLQNLRRAFCLSADEPYLSTRMSWRAHPGIGRVINATQISRAA